MQTVVHLYPMRRHGALLGDSLYHLLDQDLPQALLLGFGLSKRNALTVCLFSSDFIGDSVHRLSVFAFFYQGQGSGAPLRAGAWDMCKVILMHRPRGHCRLAAGVSGMCFCDADALMEADIAWIRKM